MIRLVRLMGLFLEGWRRLRGWRRSRRSWWSLMRSCAFDGEDELLMAFIYYSQSNYIPYYNQIYLFTNKWMPLLSFALLQRFEHLSPNTGHKRLKLADLLRILAIKIPENRIQLGNIAENIHNNILPLNKHTGLLNTCPHLRQTILYFLFLPLRLNPKTFKSTWIMSLLLVWDRSVLKYW